MKIGLPLKIILGAAAALVVGVLLALFFWFEYYRSVTFADIAKHRAKLINAIESYWSVEDLESYLTKRSLAWDLKRGQRPGLEDKRPPFIVDTVSIKNYPHLGFSGELVVEFFNNRLVGVRFFPRGIDKYIERLDSAENLDLARKREARVSEYTRVWIGEANQERKKYVGWEDVRLSNEMKQWIKRYS